VLHSKGDQTVNIGNGRYLAEKIVGASLVELPGSDHLPWLGDAEQILSEIEEFLTGARSAHEADRVLATVLFTDIVGSTDAAVRLGDRRWHETLEAHDALIRRELANFRGCEIGTAGDGFLATFDGPARAIRCACAISNAVGKLGIEIRGGLHTGECERMGDNIGGIAVHIGARVAALARGGEVLVSRTVKDLVAGSGLSFQDRGPHALKGIPGEWQLFAVEH
jgi:class 3 adenylate cyclase